MSVVTGRVTVSGTELYYETAGDGPWMVFVHGGEGTRIHWWQQMAHFAPAYRCVTFDMRGFGSSPAGTFPASDNPYRDDLLMLLDHLGADDAILVGHSMGGLAVSGVAQHSPSRVARLIMSDTAFNFATPALAEWSTQMIDKISAGFDVFEHLYAPGFAAREPALAYLFAALNRINPPFDGGGGTAAYEAWRDQPVVDYRDFPVPTLFIVGSEDELTLPWLIRRTAAAVGGSQLVELAGAGHSGYAEAPAAFNAAIERFCA